MLDSLGQAKIPVNHKYFGYAHLFIGQALGAGRLQKGALPEAEMAFAKLSAGAATTPNGKESS